MEGSTNGGVSRGVAIIVAIVAAVLFGGGTFAYVNNNATKEKKELNNRITELQEQVSDLQTASTSTSSIADTSTPTTSTTTTTDETASWKTYTSTQYGFSFKYPSAYSAVEIEKSSGETGPVGDLSVYVGSSITQSNLENSIHVIYYKTSSAEYGLGEPNGMDYTSNSATTVDSVQAKKYIGDGIEYVAIKNNHRYEIGTTSGSNTTLSGNLEKLIGTITLK